MEEQQQTPAVQPPVQDNNPVRGFFATDGVQRKFDELLGSRARGFITSVLQIVQNSDQLSRVNPVSIFNAAAMAATLDLPINQNLGFAWIVPYKGQAQFQIGYKGFIQLAQRSAQYHRLNMIPVYQNQFVAWNELKEELNANFDIRGEGEIVGYCSYFRLLNGYEKTVYWTKEKVIAHARKFSKSYEAETSSWKTDFDKMAMKTVLKNMLSVWGILSIEMQLAINVDQSILHDPEGRILTYLDNEETNEDKAQKKINETAAAMKGVQPKKRQ